MITQRSNLAFFLLGTISWLAVSNAAFAGPAEDARIKALEERLERLEKRNNELDAKNAQLDAKNKALEEKVDWRTERLEKVENKAASLVKADVSPTIVDPSGNFTFKVRGVVDADYVYFNERAGGYDYNTGTAFRRARLGAEGDAFKDFKWRLEVDFAGNVTAIQDAYVSWGGIKGWTFTAGQQKAPFSLESNTSDNYNTFIERGVANVAFGNAGAERRIGLNAQYVNEQFTAAFGIFGDNESSARADAAPDESWGFNGRATWEPINSTDDQQVLHLGASAFVRSGLKQASGTTTLKDALRLSDRPNIRVDGGLIADTGVLTSVKDINYWGLEAAGVWGPFAIQSEYGELEANRLGTLANVTFDGGYVYGSWFLTGESRTYKNGTIDRLRPKANFNPLKGNWGAVELAVRYDWFDFANTPVTGRIGNDGHSVTTALNWYLNPNTKFLFNWVRFSGDNTPLDPVGTETKGDAFAARLHLDF
jgi:phosphate-selective porin OprO/OprP